MVNAEIAQCANYESVRAIAGDCVADTERFVNLYFRYLIIFKLRLGRIKFENTPYKMNKLRAF